MLRRLLTAAIAIPLVILVISYLPEWVFLLVVLGLAGGAWVELRTLAAAHDVRPALVPWLVLICLVALRPALAQREAGFSVVSARFSDPVAADALLAAAVLFGLSALLASREPLRHALPAAGVGFVGVCWIGLLFSHIVALYSARHGASLLYVMFAAVWLGDSGAMWTGKAFGRRPLAPDLSPKKTVEGLVGGVLTSVLGVALARLVLRDRLPAGLGWLDVAALGVLLAAAACLGDLVESAFKRGAGAKDSGGFFPGHGGILDRVDSLLFAAPVMYYYVEWIARR